MQQQVPDPTVQRRRLQNALRKARAEAGMTQDQVAAEMDWSKSKVLRIEGGQIGISTTDLRAVLHLYGVTDDSAVEAYTVMARTSRHQPWGTYRDVLNPEFLVYLASESAATRIRQFEPLLIPGLLQTDAYAQMLIELFAPAGAPAETRRRQAEVRARRRELLQRSDAPQARFILDEAAIRRHAGTAPGDNAIMREQLRHLIDITEQPNVSIQIVPFRNGFHIGLRGPFVLLDFPEPDDPPILYLENPRTGSSTRDDPTEVIAYSRTYATLEAASTEPEATVSMLERAITDA